MKSPLSIIKLILLTCFLLTCCTKKDDLPSDGFLLYYPFDGSTIDLSGNNNNGINYTSGKYVSGIRKKALELMISPGNRLLTRSLAAITVVQLPWHYLENECFLQ